MNKSVFVVDTPVDCEHCQCRYAFGECGAMHRHIENGVKKPDWCPLIELPEMDGLKAAATMPDCLHPVDYARGFNDFKGMLVKKAVS